MSPAGRRPGSQDTRATIVGAARQEFQTQGYNQTTIRAVARRAQVDPSLVYHYFGDKVRLFLATQEMPFDPRSVKESSRAANDRFDGVGLMDAFLARWEESDPPGQSFVAMAQATSASPEAARAVREFVAERIGIGPPADDDRSPEGRSHALVAAQLLGVAWVRWVLQIEPLASASRQDVAAWVGPTLQRYAMGGPGATPPAKPDGTT